MTIENNEKNKCLELFYVIWMLLELYFYSFLWIIWMLILWFPTGSTYWLPTYSAPFGTWLCYLTSICPGPEPWLSYFQLCKTSNTMLSRSDLKIVSLSLSHSMDLCFFVPSSYTTIIFESHGDASHEPDDTCLHPTIHSPQDWHNDWMNHLFFEPLWGL
jgi:hypothetical protein